MNPAYYNSKTLQLIVAGPLTYHHIVAALRDKYWVCETEGQEGEPLLVIEEVKIHNASSQAQA